MTKFQKRLHLLILAGLLMAALASGAPLAAQEVTEAPAALPEAAAEIAPIESEGLTDLDEALRMKVTSKGLQDLSQVIERIEIAIDKGLDVEDNDFAEQMLSDSLMERALGLMQVINTRSLLDQRVQQIRKMATSDLRDVIAYDDPPASAYLMLGKLQALPGGDPREARRAINNFLKSKELPDAQRAEALVLYARMMKDQGKALIAMEQAIKLVPENISYRLAKAIFLRQANKLDESLATIEEVRQLSPENGNALIMQGEIYRQQNRMEEALASFDQATELAPQAPSPFQNRGEIYRQQEEYQKAIAQFNEVLKLQPGVLRTLLHRADAYLANEKLTEAMEDIEAVLEQQSLATTHPIRIAAQRLRAEVLLKMDRPEEAVKEMERVSEAMSGQLDLKMQLAKFYLFNKKPHKAIAVYSEVLELNQENFLALQARGDAYLNVGKHVEAIADFSRALKLKPEGNGAAQQLGLGPGHFARGRSARRQASRRACDQSVRIDRIQNATYPQHVGSRVCRRGELRDCHQVVATGRSISTTPNMPNKLVKELDSYRDGQPWREKQNSDEPTTPEPQEEPQEEPQLPALSP